MKNKIVALLCFLFVFLFFYISQYLRWNHYWATYPPLSDYKIVCHDDDTIRVVMIGDSWAAIHSEMNMDSFLCSKIKKEIKHPVKIQSRGIGGGKTKTIYELMFQSKNEGTKNLFLSDVDYCIVTAGINDAAANLGTKHYCYYYRLILDFLIRHSICPVVIEIPNVDIWNVYGSKPWKDLVVDYMRATMTQCNMYNYSEYREALKAMLYEDYLMKHVIYVPMVGWNEDGEYVNHNLFMADRVHLNRSGYEKLDVCIAKAIVSDLQQAQDTALVYNPMNKNAE